MISYELIWAKASSYETCFPHMKLFFSHMRHGCLIWYHMRSYEVKQCFENCRVPPFSPWISGCIMFFLGLCCLPLWQSSLVLRLLYIFWSSFCRAHILEKEIGSPFAGPILSELFCKALGFRFVSPFARPSFHPQMLWAHFFLPLRFFLCAMCHPTSSPPELVAPSQFLGGCALDFALR